MNSILHKSVANFVGNGLQRNNIFDLSSSGNRDGCFEPYLLLKRNFLTHGIEINTADVNRAKNILFELHMNVQPRARREVPSYVLLCEPPQIWPFNRQKKLMRRYSRVFTWRDDLVDGNRYIKLSLPNKIVVSNSRGWQGRNKLCCMIAGNKTVLHKSPIELYSERVKTIHWFEQHAPQDFDLFGQGWDRSAARSGWAGRVVRKARRYIISPSGTNYFPSYQGEAAGKIATMRKYRFGICYENVRDLPGYITEKIFDCFFAGCIPVYWGASNIGTYIPENCFIDRRNFAGHEKFHSFMVSMTEPEFSAYQKHIAAFLTSDSAKPFSAEIFAETIVKAIISDLGIGEDGQTT